MHPIISKQINDNIIKILTEKKQGGKVLSSASSQLSGRAVKAIRYIKELEKKKPVENIYELEHEKIEGILDGIKVFKGVPTEDLYLMPGIIDILTQRGCSNACLHCFIKARNVFSTIKWDDFTRFTRGLRELKQRLGFHIFEIKREKYDVNRRDYTLSQGLYPYLDADPIELKSFDDRGKVHSIKDFVKKFYDDLKQPLKVKTVGWDRSNDYCQTAAEGLVNLMLNPKYKDACPGVIVSMHPFHKIMTLANKGLKNKNNAVYQKYRNIYVERMSNVLKTFLPLAKIGKLLINPQYAIGGLEGSGYTRQDIKILCKNILEKLEDECKSEKIDSSFFTAEKDIEKNAFFEPINPILSVARAKKEFLNDYSANTYSFEKGKDGSRNIVVTPFDIKHAFANEVSENIVNNIKAQENFIDNIIINIDPVNDSDLKIAGKNKLSANRSKMFMEKIIYTLKRFGEVKNLILRLNYSDGTPYNKKALEKIISQISGITGKTYPDIEYKETSEELVKTTTEDSKTAFKNIILNLNDEGKVRFISQLRKGINVDGRVYIPVVNTRSFGEDFFENRALLLDNLKFNFSEPHPYIFDKNLSKDRIEFDIKEISKLERRK